MPSLKEANEFFPKVYRRGDSNWGVITLQIAMNTQTSKPGLVLDGSFGPATESAVKTAQDALNIKVDGVCGSETQEHFCRSKCNKTRTIVPAGLIWGLVKGESNGYFASTSPEYTDSHTRDYFAFQDNKPVTATRDQLVAAANPESEAWRVAGEIAGKFAQYRKLPQTVRPDNEEAWKLALFAYNWPVGADALAKGEGAWMSKDIKFVVKLGEEGVTWEGKKVKTGLDWYHFYVGTKDDYVTSWSVG